MSQPFLGKLHFARKDQGTDEDFRVLQRVHEQTIRDLPDRLFSLLDDLGRDTAYNITRRDHCLLAATRALRDGKDVEYVVVAFITRRRRIARPVQPRRGCRGGAAAVHLPRPSLVAGAARLFQTYIFASHLGLDPNARERFKGDPAYDRTVEFCAKYDRLSINPAFLVDSRTGRLIRWVNTPEAHWPLAFTADGSRFATAWSDTRVRE
jgi:hypothetical protein